MAHNVSKRVDDLAHEMVDVARALVARGLVVGSVGNVSARVAGGFLITPTRMRYGEMEAEDLVHISLSGVSRESTTFPSVEWPMHCQIYQARADVGAVVHAHSLYATAWSFLSEPLEPRLEDSRYYGIDRICTSPMAPAGSDDLAQAAVSTLGESRAALLGHHGIIAVGATLDEALIVMEIVEREAHTSWLLRGVQNPEGARS